MDDEYGHDPMSGHVWRRYHAKATEPERDETIEVGGRTWTLEEARAVVTFVDGGGLGEIPPGLGSEACIFIARVPGGGPELTREHVEALRDFVEPWIRVDYGDAWHGELFMFAECEFVSGHTAVAWSVDDHCAVTFDSDDTILVRRPRRPKLTLAGLEPGTRFRFANPANDLSRETYTRTDCGYLHGWEHYDDEGLGHVEVEVLP